MNIDSLNSLLVFDDEGDGFVLVLLLLPPLPLPLSV